MTHRDEPFVISAEELAPAGVTPSDAPPPPDEMPTGAAMVRVTRLAGRERRGRGLLWSLAGSLVALVVSVATYEYLMGLIARYPTLGKVAVALTGLLVLVVLVHVARELWAFRRLARIDGFRAEAPA